MNKMNNSATTCGTCLDMVSAYKTTIKNKRGLKIEIHLYKKEKSPLAQMWDRKI